MERKAGSRVTSKKAFVGEGKTLSSTAADSTFRKRAGAREAVDARLQAAEKRERDAKRLKQEEAVKDEPRAGTSAAGARDWVDLDSDSDEEDQLDSEEEEVARPTIKAEDEADVKPYSEEELRYLRADRWDDDFLVVGAGAGSVTVPSGGKGDGGKGKGKGKQETEVITLSDSDDG